MRASVSAAMMPMMPTTYVQIWPQRICALPGMSGLKRFMKSVTTAVDAEERFAESVEIVAAKTAAMTSPASHGGISVAMKNLRQNGYITVTPEGFIYLTDSGKEIAEMIYERHEFLSNWLISLGVDEKTATEDACHIEHDLSKESFQAIKNFISHSM